MARKPSSRKSAAAQRASAAPARAPGRSSSLIDTRVIYCGDNLEQLAKLPDGCVDLIYIDPLFNSNHDYEVFWGERSEPRAQASGFFAFLEPRPPALDGRVANVIGSGSGFFTAVEDRHACPLRRAALSRASTQPYIDYMSTDLAASGGRPRCVELARVLKKTGSSYYHCDWHASQYVKVIIGRQYPPCGPARARDNSIVDRRDLPIGESVATEDAAHA